MDRFKAIIAAGGKGARLQPLTFTSNKHLIPIANKPLLLYAIENIVAAGIKNIGIIVNESRPAIENLLGDGASWKVKITYINQEQPLGVAHVIKISQEFLAEDPFIYHLGDNIFTAGIRYLLEQFLKTKSDAMFAVIEHEENFRLGVPFFENGKLVKVAEKPKNPPNKFGIPGLYFFNSNVFKAFSGKEAIKPSARGELEITDVFNFLLSHGYQVDVAKLKGKWLDPGKFDDSLEANRILLELNCKRESKGNVDKKSKITGEVSIGKKTIVKNSRINGPSSIGENVHIENSNIGPNTSIASGCKIVNSAVENTIIMEGTEIINYSFNIKESMIGKNSIIQGKHYANPTCKLIISDTSQIEIS